MRIISAILTSALSLSCYAGTLVYCPPNDAIECNNGKCTLQSGYLKDWELSDVVGYPTGKQKFIVAFKDNLNRLPGKCKYVSTANHDASVILSSLVNYLKMSPAYIQGISAWWDDSHATASCGFGNVIQENCPYEVY